MVTAKNRIPKSKRKKKVVIKPVVKKCIACKIRKVTDHHLICNKCCSERDKKKYLKKRSRHPNLAPKDELKREEMFRGWNHGEEI